MKYGHIFSSVKLPNNKLSCKIMTKWVQSKSKKHFNREDTLRENNLKFAFQVYTKSHHYHMTGAQLQVTKHIL